MIATVTIDDNTPGKINLTVSFSEAVTEETVSPAASLAIALIPLAKDLIRKGKV